MSKTTASTHGGIYNPAIPLALIDPSPMNPRKHFDPVKMKELAASITEKGVIQPIVVRPKGKRFEIVAGERRWRGSQIAKKETIPGIVRDLDDKSAIEIQTIENLQREDVNPIDEAVGFWLLHKEHGYSVKQLADKIGKTERYVARRMVLTALVKELWKPLQEGILLIGVAEIIAPLPKDAQKEFIEANKWQMKEGETVSVAEARRFLNRASYDLKNAPWELDDAKLLPAIGACLTCPKRAGSNPTLFEGLTADTCTDKSCFRAKLDAFVEREFQKDPDLVRVADDYSSTKTAGVVAQGSYREVKKGECKFSQNAIVGKGYKIGRKLLICVSKECKRHQAGPSRSSNPGMAAALERTKKNQRERAAIVAVMKAFHQSRMGTIKSTAPVDDMLRETVERMWERANMHHQKAVALAIGLEKQSSKKGGYEHTSYDLAFQAYLKEHYAHGDLIDLVMLIVASWTYEYVGIEWIRKWAKLGESLGKKYSVARIEKEVQARFVKKAKKKAGAK